jgi:tetratricopeptide (TPR) repeat protein
MALVSLLQRQDSAAARDEATSLCQEAVAIAQDDLTARLSLANLYTESNRLADANDHYQYILQKNPKNVGALVGLAVINRKRGRYNDALAHYKEALKNDPENRQLHYNLGLLYDYYLNQPDEARGHYQRYLALDGDPQLLPEEFRPEQTTKPVVPKDPDAKTPPPEKVSAAPAEKPLEKAPEKKPRKKTPLREIPDDNEPSENLRAPKSE